ncbi:MAG TPA: FtsX-like permease family protein [Chryseosolibacter sp.]|nr:FtsX-like permease family protein [Chryseosolibacter sp.]
MIRHNLKLVLRSLWTKWIYSLITLLSLTVGFLCTNILISFLVFENNTDTFHTKRDRTFQVFSNDPFGGKGLIAYVPDYFFNYLTANYAEVQNVCQIGNLDGVTIEESNDRYENFKVLSVDSSFFTLFDFPLLRGRKDKCLSPDEIVLSKDKALTLFGGIDVVGNRVKVSTPDTTREVTVSAIVDKTIENSHLNFDALLHHSAFSGKFNGGATYALLTSANAREALLQKLNSDRERPGLIGLGKMDYFFNPLTESYFSADNKMSFMRTRNPMLLKVGYVVCGLVLFIAGFNFINLFLLSWQNRRKEIGIKKALGVTRNDLFSFSLTEAGVYVFTGFLLSLILAFYTIPVFNNVFEASLSLQYFLNLEVLALTSVVLFILGASVVILSVSKQWSMKPINLIGKDSSRIRFSRLLFTIQFVISITLAICSVTIVQQMSHIERAPLGFNRHIVQLNAPDKKYSQALAVLKQRITQLPDVNNATVSNGNPIFGNMIIRYDLDNGQFYTPYLFGGDEDYLKTLDLKLVEGELPSEINNGKLVNQTLVRQFNLKKAVGEQVPGTKDVIVGVVEDFTCGSFKQEIPPAIISFNKEGESLLVDYRGSDLSKLLPKIQVEWGNMFPDHFFTYRIIQEELMKKHKEDTFFYKIIITFSVISMILSCFGMFALSWAVIQSRTKEMGIRKVLGATALDIFNLLTLTFTKRIILAFVIAAPVAYYLMNQWLTRFANRIELNVWIFGIAGLMVTIIAFMTLSLQTVKATMTNPVDEIRNE